MSSKRTGKFYRKNEDAVMRGLGLTPTKNSGSGWIEKEDGYNEAIICQLKSTDKSSISIKQQDLHTLEYNAAVSHKLPLFAIQFLNTDEVWLMAKSTDFPLVANGLGGTYEPRKPYEGMEEWLDGVVIGHMDDPGPPGELGPPGQSEVPEGVVLSVKSDPLAKEKFFKQLEEDRERRKRK